MMCCLVYNERKKDGSVKTKRKQGLELDPVIFLPSLFGEIFESNIATCLFVFYFETKNYKTNR